MKHGFFMHKLCQVPRELLKSKVFNIPPALSCEGPGKYSQRDLALLHKFKQNAKQGQIFGHFFCLIARPWPATRILYTEMHSACRNQQDNGDEVREVGSIAV